MIHIAICDDEKHMCDHIRSMERLYASMQNASEDSLLVQKGYEGRIIPKDEIVFCEI